MIVFLGKLALVFVGFGFLLAVGGGILLYFLVRRQRSPPRGFKVQVAGAKEEIK